MILCCGSAFEPAHSALTLEFGVFQHFSDAKNRSGATVAGLAGRPGR
jgi:hypothetical protein